MAPRGRRRVEIQPWDGGEIGTGAEDGVGQPAFGLIHPDDVSPFRVSCAIHHEGLAGLFNLHVVEDQEVYQAGCLVRTLLQGLAGRYDISGRKFLHCQFVVLLPLRFVQQVLAG